MAIDIPDDLIPEPAQASLDIPDDLIPEPVQGDVGNGLVGARDRLAAYTDPESALKTAQGEIAARRAGRKLVRTPNAEGGFDYTPTETTPQQLGPSEQSAIIEAHRQQFDPLGLQKPMVDPASDFYSNAAQVTQSQIEGQSGVRNAANAFAADLLSLPIQARTAATYILNPEGQVQNTQQSARELDVLREGLPVNPDSVGGLVGNVAGGGVRYGLMFPAAVAAAGGESLVQSQQARDAGASISPEQESLMALANAANAYGAGKLTQGIGGTAGRGFTDPLARGAMQTAVAGETGMLDMAGMTVGQDVINTLGGQPTSTPEEFGTAMLTGGVVGPLMHGPKFLAEMRARQARSGAQARPEEPAPLTERRVSDQPVEIDRRKAELNREIDQTLTRTEQKAAELEKLFPAQEPANPFAGLTHEQMLAKVNAAAAEAPAAAGPTTTPPAAETPRSVAEPAVLEGPEALAKWYSQKYGKSEMDSFGITAMSEPGRYVLADVPTGAVKDTRFMGDEVDMAKASKYAAMPAESAPPLLTTGSGEELMISDGGHRLEAAKLRGDATVRAYVPERFLQQEGIKAVGAKEIPLAPRPAEEAPPVVEQAPSELSLAAGEPTVRPELMGTETRSRAPKVPVTDPKRDLKALLAGKEVPIPETKPTAPEEPVPENKPESKLFADAVKSKPDRTLMRWDEIPDAPAVVEGSPVPPPPRAPEKGLGFLRSTVREIGELTGSDVGLMKTPQKVANNLREMMGNQKLAAAELDAHFTKIAKLADELAPDEAAALIHEIESGIPTADTRFKKFQEDVRALNAQNIARAKELGWEVEGWTPDWIGRMFEFPDAKGKFPGETGYSGTPGTLAGPEKFLKSRTYETYAEALDAVESAGGRPKYENPVVMATAKAIEVSNSLIAHETFQRALKAGHVHPMEGAPRPGFKEITDPIRWTHKDTGKRYQAREDIAQLFNHVSSRPATGKLAELALAVNRGATRIRMALDIRHYWTEALGASMMMYGQAARDLFRGQFAKAGKEALLGTPFVGLPFVMREGKAKVSRPLASGEKSDVLKAIASGGGDVAPHHSILKDSDWVAMKKAYARGDKVAATQGFISNTLGQINKTLFERYIPTVRKGIAAVLAESEVANAQKKGVDVKSAEFKDVMAKHMLALNNILGVEDSRIHFQNKTAANVSRLLFGLPNWFLGKARVTTDAARGFKPLFQGKNADPATYHFLGGLMSMGVAGTVTYALLNGGKMPQKWSDIRHVPTPWLDENGDPIKITIPYPMEAIVDLASGDRSATEVVKNRLSPLVAFANDMATGQDFRGAPTRDTWQDVAKTMADNFATPFGVSAMGRPGNTPALKALGIAGISRSAKKFSNTEAERLAMEIIQTNSPQGRRSREDIEHSDMVNQFAKDIRNNRADVFKRLGDDIASGKLRPEDVKSVFEKAQQEPGMPRLLKSPELHPSEVMQVWDAMTPDEKKKNQLAVLKRIGNTKVTHNFSLADKLSAMRKIAEVQK